MKKISNIMNRLVSRKENAEKNENGFSLLELVVAIGILLVLTVGGLIGYAQITDNARGAAQESAASEIATEVMVKINDGGLDGAGITKLVGDYNDDNKTYKDLDITYDTDAKEISVDHIKLDNDKTPPATRVVG